MLRREELDRLEAQAEQLRREASSIGGASLCLPAPRLVELADTWAMLIAEVRRRRQEAHELRNRLNDATLALEVANLDRR